MTTRDPHYFEIRVTEGDIDYHPRARIVISPHFSYDDNFVPHARFSTEDWDKFETDFPKAVTDLKEQDRVTGPNEDNNRGISVTDFKTFQDDCPLVTIVIVQHLVDPSAMIGQGVAQEILMGNIPFNEADGHLALSSGDCSFCVNKSWTFPEGCPYKKNEESPIGPDTQDRAVEYVLQHLEDAMGINL